MREKPEIELENNRPRFSTHSMKALQIIQTFLLLIVMGLAAWIGATTVESARSISRMEETIRNMNGENARISNQVEKLWEEHYALDRRVTKIEAREKP